jgi:hypothetical protein
MERINLYAFYHVGQELERIRSETMAGTVIEDDTTSLNLHLVKLILDHFLKSSFSTTLHLTRKAAEDAIKHLDEVIGENAKQKSDIFFLARLQECLKLFDTIFANESPDANVFSVSKRGTHSILDLLGKADENLSADVRSRLPKEAIEDIRQAGKCLALDCHTVVGFHILRAVESLIRVYHNKLTHSVTAQKSRNWGVYIKDLKKHGADSRITGYLEHLKDHYRNPIAHPEAVLSANEAFSLFNASLSAISLLDAAIQATP